jgi:phospholipase/lecithinase/hemolysin
MNGFTSLSVVVLGLASLGGAYSATFDDVVVYGGSLSDNGNVFRVTSLLGMPTPPSPPYFEGRFSNGPVAVEILARDFGAPLLDFAFGGATTGLGDEGDGGSVTTLVRLPGMTSQFLGSKSQVAPIASHSLFIVWGGPDDLASPSPGQTTPVEVAHTASANIINIVKGIEALGGTEILVPGAPDLGVSPSIGGNAAAARLFATTFNADLIAGLPTGAIYIDTYDALDELVANPSAFGLSNVTETCLVGSTPCANPDQYLFWDGQHPTESVQLLFAREMEATIPEPGTGLLGLSALGMVALMWRRAGSRETLDGIR